MAGQNNSLNLLMLSKGSFEGNHIISALFGHNVYGSGTDPVRSQVNGCNVSITNIQISLDGKNPGSVAREAQEKIKGVTFDGVLVVLALPIRSTPESQRHLHTIKRIIGTKVLRSNTILLFTNGSYMNRNPHQFQQFLLNEIMASNQDGLREASLGKLIKETHYPRNQNWVNCDFRRCVLLDTDCKDVHEKTEQNERLLNSARLLSPFTATGSYDLPPGISYGVMGGLILIMSLLGITAMKNYDRGSVPADTAQTVDSLRNLLQSQTQQIMSLQTNIIDLNNTHIQSILGINKMHRAEVSGLHDNIQVLSTQRDQLEQTVKDKNDEIVYKNIEIANRDKEIESCKRERNLYRKKYKNTLIENGRLRRDMKSVTCKLATLGKEVKYLQHKLLKPPIKEKGYIETFLGYLGLGSDNSD